MKFIVPHLQPMKLKMESSEKKPKNSSRLFKCRITESPSFGEVSEFEPKVPETPKFDKPEVT